MDKSYALKNGIYSRPPHFHKDFPLILFWSEKSGCTALIKWFFFQIGLLDKALEHSPWVHEFEIKIYKNQSGYRDQVEDHLLNSNKKVYKLVRNPYERAVSSFIFMHTHHLGLLGNVKQFLYNDRKIKEGISFKQFLQFLKEIGAGVGKVDGHLAQQYVPGEELFVHDYIHLEHFESKIKEIEKQYGLIDSPIDKLTKSEHHNRARMIYEGDFADVKTTDPLFKAWPMLNSFYNDETKLLVEEVFHYDFKAFGYEYKL